MFRLTLTLTILALAGLIIWVIWQHSKAKEEAWQEALLNPQWERAEITFGGDTYVTVELVSRLGNRHHSYGKDDVMGHVNIKSPDWQLTLETLRMEADNRARVLNEARNKGVKE